jgi:iron(III) transport system ATP-binding protein
VNAVELVELEKALLGPSGCGKTTTLRMIAGLERPDRGVVRLSGAVVDDGRQFVPPERRGLGMVFQSYAVWPHKSVFENVAYPLKLRGERDLEPKVREALGWVRLATFANRRPHELSGGQLQRVALARALVGRPQVLLLDEPLSNLDVALREELRGEIASLRTTLGTTMILVTHDQAEALALADRVAVMNKGVIEQLAPPEQLYREPSTAFVAGFVGGANVLDGELRDGRFHLEGLVFEVPGERLPDGRCTLAIRTEDVALEPGGPELPLSARLYMGSTTELRFALGGQTLRSTGASVPLEAGTRASVRFKAVRRFEPRSP